MKTTLMMIAVAALAAGTALAQQGDGYGQKMQRDGKPARGQMDKRGGERPDGPMSEEMRAEMHAERDAIRDLVGAARLETDETKKAELVGQLRGKLSGIADRMQAHQEERLAQAEERFNALKERIEYARDHRDELIEEQLQRLLAGERPERPAAFKDFPFVKGQRGEAEGEDRPGRPPRGNRPPPPPPGDDIPEDTPPPPLD
jgi:hypothetical protein